VSFSYYFYLSQVCEAFILLHISYDITVI